MKKLLKVFGILSILLGLFYIVPYTLACIMALLLGVEADTLNIGNLIIVGTGIVQLIAGILSLITLKKPRSCVPALILIAVCLILSIIEAIPSMGNGVMNTITGISVIVLNGLGLMAILRVRKNSVNAESPE